ncbi:Flap endonuclease GEN 1 [Mactra antiquata]
MGVTQLWQVLGPVEQHVPLSSLNGQTLAVDLSIWVCENQGVKQMQGVVAKPFLRNLFFRISHLTQLGVKLVFVIEGDAPELKWDTMAKRQQTRYFGRTGKQSPQKQAVKQTRRNFNRWLKECCELLEIMGIPYIQSRGEAEALCALLNAEGLVDGCLTNDGDAFLYGAKCVYRNFTMNSKDPHVEMFKLSDMESKLDIDRNGLIALGLLVGCDFVPKGVPGIGIANSVRLLQSLSGLDILKRFQLWKTMSEKDCIDQVEVQARRKAIQVPEFPQTKVIDEFITVKDRCPSQLPQWKRPVLAKLQEFALVKLEWPIEYTLEKILPLMTLWDMLDILQSQNPSTHQHLKPNRIVKTRVRQGESCYELEWYKPVTESFNEDEFYVTIENQQLFNKCYPEIVKIFETESSENKKKSKGKKKKKKQTTTVSSTPDLDNLSFKFEKMNLDNVTSGLQKSVQELQPSFSGYDESSLTTKAKQPRHLTLSPNNKKPAGKSTTCVSNKTSEASSISLNSDTKIDRKLNFQDGSKQLAEKEATMSLSERVKLRMKNKTDSTTNNVSSTTTKCTKNMGTTKCVETLSSKVQNLSLSEHLKVMQNVNKESPVAKVTKSSLPSSDSPVIFGTKQSSVGTIPSLQKNVHRISSPASDSFCSPSTFMKHTGNLGDSFEIEKSPYYIECPLSQKQRTSVNGPDFDSPGYFSRSKPVVQESNVDTKSDAEKLIEKLESGIKDVGTSSKNKLSMFGGNKLGSIGNEEISLKSIQSFLNNSNGSILASSNLKNVTPSRMENQSVLNSSTPSEYGDFNLQASLMNSLCSSLVQALTPKGVSMTKSEYEKLVATINEIDSEENSEVPDTETPEEADFLNDIDIAEIEKVSSNFKNMKQNLLLRPIQIDDEDVMSKLSKSARKKLRRKERKVQEMENLVKIQNMSLNKQKLNKKQKSDLKTRLSHPNDDNDGTKRKKQIICSPSKDHLKGISQVPLENNTRNGSKRNGDGKDEPSKSVRSLAMELKADFNSNKHNRVSANNFKELKQNEEDKLSKCHGNQPVNTPDVDSNEKNKKKKKRKKKIRKVSSVIDLSGNDSILDNSKIATCEKYLNLALENSRKKNETKIEKASPIMDLSADDTLLELQGLSCKVLGDELDKELSSKLRIKSVKQRKTLHGHGIRHDEAKIIETSVNSPVLSLANKIVDTEESRNVDSVNHGRTEVFVDVTNKQKTGCMKCTCGMKDLSNITPVDDTENENDRDIDDTASNKLPLNGEMSEKEHQLKVSDCVTPDASKMKNDPELSQNCDKLGYGNENKWCYNRDVRNDVIGSNLSTEVECTNENDSNEKANITELVEENVLLDVEGNDDDTKEIDKGIDEKVVCVGEYDNQNENDSVFINKSNTDKVQEENELNENNLNGENCVQELDHETDRCEMKFGASKTDGLNKVEDSYGMNQAETLDSGLTDKVSEINQSSNDQSIIFVSCSDGSNKENMEVSNGNYVPDQTEMAHVLDSSSVDIADLKSDSNREPTTFMNYWSANEEKVSNIADKFTPSKSLFSPKTVPLGPCTHSEISLENGSQPNGLHTNADENVPTKSLVINGNDDPTTSDDDGIQKMAQSPACLADRLKLKLRHGSTRNVLESFTNYN